MPTARRADAVLREAREIAGLSRAQFALRMGVSWATARQVEEGGDPRLSTLQGVLDALPFLGPGALLGGAASSPPLGGSAHAWRTLADLHGFSANLVRLTARVVADGPRKLTLEVAGVTSLSESLRDEGVRTNLMRAVVPGPAVFVRDLVAEPQDLRGVGREAVTDDVSHAFTFPRDLDRRGFSYVRRWERARLGPDAALLGEPTSAAREAEAVAHDLTFPVRRLELVLEVADAERCPAVAGFVAPDTVVPPLGAFELARAHAPHGFPARWDARGRRLTVTIDWPLLAMRMGVAFLTDVPGHDDVPAPFVRLGASRAVVLGGLSSGGPPATVATRLRLARERAGLSRRQLAHLMETSPATVIETEAGKDPRRSTLERWLRALPELRPSDFFVPPRGDLALSSREAWTYQRNLFGAEAELVSRTVTLRRTGSAAERIGVGGLRRLHRGRGPLVVKDGISLARHGRVGPVFLAGVGTPRASELRVRWQHDPGVAPELYLALPEELLESGASWTRNERKERAYKMRADDVARSIGPAFECLVPARRLILEVQFPRGWWPPEVAASARAAVTVTNPRWPDLRERAHAGGHSLALDPHAGTARFTVERPLIGLRYSIRWRAG